MHGIDRDESDAEVFIEILVSRNVTATALETHFHIKLAAFAHGCDVNIFVEDFNVGIRLDHARSDHPGLVRAQIDCLGRIGRKLERNLLEVEDDIGGILHDAGDRLKFVQHAFDLDGGDGCALNRTEQHAPQSVADSGTEAALKRLCPKHAVFVSQVLGVDGETFRFLKAFPKHCFLHSAIWLSHGSPNRPEFGSSAVTGGSGTKNGPKLSRRSLVIGRRTLVHPASIFAPMDSRGRLSIVILDARVGSNPTRSLLTVQFYDQLLVDRQLDVFALGQGNDASLVIVTINAQPVGRVLVTGEIFRLLENGQLAAAFANCDLLTYIHLVGRDVDFAPVHMNMAVTHELARLPAGQGEPQAIDNIVQASLKLLQEHFAGHTFSAGGLLKVVAELAFLGEVNAFGFLLLAQLETVTYDLGFTVFPVLSGSEVAFLNGTFVAEALAALEEQLHALAAAETTYCIFVTCQVELSF